jgi:hydrogenase maturation protease
MLACGNTLRGDDGVGPWLAAWAEERFASDARVRVLVRQQWTPELAQDVAEAQAVIFVDCAVDLGPGEVRVSSVELADGAGSALATHHLGAAELVALSKELYGAMPGSSLLLTVGAGSLELGEGFSEAVKAALPAVCARLEKAVLEMLADPG